MKKLVGIFIVMLLIGTAILPVSGRFLLYEEDFMNKNNEKILLDSSKLKWIIAGEGLRCLRAYRIYVPPSYDDSRSVPLVLAFDGATDMGVEFNPIMIYYYYRSNFFENYTKLSDKADEEEFIVVYPKALALFTFFDRYTFLYNSPHFPDNWFKNNEYVDDVGFIDDLIVKIQGEYNIDSNKIYLTGLSSGADFIYYYASAKSDKIAAFAPVAGETAKKEANQEEYIFPPKPENPVSVIVFHGTNDQTYPWDGDQWGCGVEPSIDFWVENNGCDKEPEINESESGKIVKYTYSNGIDGTEVILYKSIGGSHCWPGNEYNSTSASWLIDTIQEIDATDLIWEFFESHPKQ